MVTLDWRIAVTLLVALLLTVITFEVWRLRLPEKDQARRAVLWLFVPATVWAWESTLREIVGGAGVGLWPVLDTIAGIFALIGALIVFRWLYRGGKV